MEQPSRRHRTTRRGLPRPVAAAQPLATAVVGLLSPAAAAAVPAGVTPPDARSSADLPGRRRTGGGAPTNTIPCSVGRAGRHRPWRRPDPGLRGRPVRRGHHHRQPGAGDAHSGLSRRPGARQQRVPSERQADRAAPSDYDTYQRQRVQPADRRGQHRKDEVQPMPPGTTTARSRYLPQRHQQVNGNHLPRRDCSGVAVGNQADTARLLVTIFGFDTVIISGAVPALVAPWKARRVYPYRTFPHGHLVVDVTRP